MLSKNKLRNCLIFGGITAFSFGALRLMTVASGSASARAMSTSLISGPNSIMDPKAHGTCPAPVQQKLRYGCDTKVADNICCFNRHYAEYSGYAFSNEVTWVDELTREQSPAVTKYYDSVTGKLLFAAPVGRDLSTFIKES